MEFTGAIATVLSIAPDPSGVPGWIKLVVTAYVCILVPIYWRRLGPANFLWFSDIALFGACAALWLESPLLASMQAVSVLLFEIIWNVDFALGLIVKFRPTGISSYMFDRRMPIGVRALSLFHVWLPPLLVWMVYRLGYDPRAWIAQTLLSWIVLVACYHLVKRDQNVNWVFGPWGRPQNRLPPLAYLALLMVGLSLCVYLPTHLLLMYIMPTRS